jgi:hypothetical protein
MNDQKTCVICLNSLDHQHFHKLPCGHEFHTDCIVKWFRQSGSCPLCLDNKRKPYGYYGFWNNNYIQNRCSAIKKYSRSKHCDDKQLQKKIIKLDTLENDLSILKKNNKDWDKLEDYKLLRKEYFNQHKKLKNKQKQIINHKIKIISLYPTLFV